MSKLNNNEIKLVKIDRHYQVPKNSKYELKKALQLGPVATYLNADSPDFMYYSGGILDSKNCTPRYSHAVIIVGYG